MTGVVTLYGLRELPDGSKPENEVEWVDPRLGVGIEIEVEREDGVVLSDNILTFWNKKQDGSLRNGVEYVLNAPYNGEDLTCAIEEFFNNNQVRKSATSGTHIHIDMRDKKTTLDVVKVMASIITCIEPAIFGMFAEGREWCGYTNKLTTLPAPAIDALFAGDDRDFRSVFTPNTREYKYYGFNMLPIGRYGSIEFRYFNTAENADELIEWVQFCMSVKVAALKINHRGNFKYYLSSEQAWVEFIEKFFPKWRDKMVAMLPYKEVALRNKQMLSRAGKSRKKLKRNSSEDNPLLNSKFKRFFAMKIKDSDSGKSKIVYDISSIYQHLPVRVFMSSDPAMSGGPTFRDGDFLLHTDMVYAWSNSRLRWMECLCYDLDPDRALQVYTKFSQTTMRKFIQGCNDRLSGALSGSGIIDLTLENSNRSRNRMEKVGAIVAALCSQPQAEVQSGYNTIDLNP